MQPERLDPNSILKYVKREELKTKGGKLKIFFGMCAGVGKTYAMLEAAQQKKSEGINIIVGIVETHGRPETAKLVEKLPSIPLKEVIYKDAVFHELDIDAIINAKPQIVIIDELAHTNIPGSRHPKRWQDVLEILDRGIDVYTTMNVQHLESRKDIIEAITNISIRETVPDLVLERAAEIRLVDISPPELLKRLSEGKVYLGDTPQLAMENFFKEGNLTALRELALRFIAEQVDHELHTMMAVGKRESTWKTTERLLVAVSASTHSENLIRTTRRLAFNLDAPWIALHIDTGYELDEKEQTRLTKNLAFARELGAEVITTTDVDVVNAIHKISKQNNVTQIVMGRSPKLKLLAYFTGGTVLERLASEASDIDLHVVRQIPSNVEEKRANSYDPVTISPATYFKTFLWVLLLTFINVFLEPYTGYRATGYIYLFGILALSLFTGRGPILFAAALSALIWDFFFIPPGNVLFMNKNSEDLLLLGFYFIAAVTTGTLIGRIRTRELMISKREEQTKALYDVLREFTGAHTPKDIYNSIAKHVGKLLRGECAIIPKTLFNGLNFENLPVSFDDKEKAVAIWVFSNGKEAGFSTDTLSSVSTYFIPLIAFDETVGVLTYKPIGKKQLSTDDITFLYTVGRQIAQHLHHANEEELKRREHNLEQAEKIHRSFMTMVSEQINTPLKVLTKASQALQKTDLAQVNVVEKRLINEIEETTGDLNNFVENMFVKSRVLLEFMAPMKEVHHIKELVDNSINSLKKELKAYHLQINIPENIMRASFDLSLLEIVVCNLLDSSVKNSEPGTTIEITARNDPNYVVLAIADEGNPLPEGVRFPLYRSYAERRVSDDSHVAVGLAIARNIMALHNGRFEYRNKPQGGVEFSIYIPIKQKKQATQIQI